jgi:hypothetical protein
MISAFRTHLSVSLIFGGILYWLSGEKGFAEFAQPGFRYFLPWLAVIFLFNIWLSFQFLKWIDQPPLMIFLLTMVIKMLMSLTVLLIYLLKGLGPQNQGAGIFILIYLIFEILEIKRFLSILRPDSRERKPE